MTGPDIIYPPIGGYSPKYPVVVRYRLKPRKPTFSDYLIAALCLLWRRFA